MSLDSGKPPPPQGEHEHDAALLHTALQAVQSHQATAVRVGGLGLL